MRLAIIGVDTGAGPDHRALGRWETYHFGDRVLSFMPVVRLDPADQKRRLPHSLRLLAGTIRYWRRIPQADLVQAHRMDTALALRLLGRRRQAYFIHTQEHGLTGSTSDSKWRRAARLHERLERHVIAKARQVVVFNPDYAESVQKLNPAARFSPTWFDPAVVPNVPESERKSHSILWVGRLEIPKDPVLAIRAFDRLVHDDAKSPWELHIVGSGTLLESTREAALECEPAVAKRIHLHGRLSPGLVAQRMRESDVFLMTSHAGYEGYPRVLVEAMAAGLRPVVTSGSDTGGLIEGGSTGRVTDRSPQTIARVIRDVHDIDRATVRARVTELSAPEVIRRLYDHSPTPEAK